MLNIIAFGKVYASDIQVVQPEYTKEYNDYINLSEEEKKNAIVPRKYNISGKESTNEAILQNENVPFGKLITLAQASAYSNEKTFSLKNYIPNNLKIKNHFLLNNKILNFLRIIGILLSIFYFLCILMIFL